MPTTPLLLRLIAALTLCALLTGCQGTHDVVSSSRTMIMYRLDANVGKTTPSDSNFHGWTILQTCPITDPEQQDSIRQALQQSIDDSDGRSMRCFIPRHGLREIDLQGRVVDHVICFQCLNYHEYIDEQSRTSGTLTRSALDTFDQILSECN
jgi:hypothetical protein